MGLPILLVILIGTLWGCFVGFWDMKLFIEQRMKRNKRILMMLFCLSPPSFHWILTLKFLIRFCRKWIYLYGSYLQSAIILSCASKHNDFHFLQTRRNYCFSFEINYLHISTLWKLQERYDYDQKLIRRCITQIFDRLRILGTIIYFYFILELKFPILKFLQ